MEKLSENFKDWIFEEEDSRVVDHMFLREGVVGFLPVCFDAFNRGVVGEAFMQEVLILAVHRVFVDIGVPEFELYEMVEEALGPEWLEFLEGAVEEYLYSEGFDEGGFDEFSYSFEKL